MWLGLERWQQNGDQEDGFGSDSGGRVDSTNGNVCIALSRLPHTSMALFPLIHSRSLSRVPVLKVRKVRHSNLFKIAATNENMPAPRRCTGLCWHVCMQVYTCVPCVCYLRLAPELLTAPSVGSWEAECARRAQPAMPTDEDHRIHEGIWGL